VKWRWIYRLANMWTYNLAITYDTSEFQQQQQQHYPILSPLLGFSIISAAAASTSWKQNTGSYSIMFTTQSYVSVNYFRSWTARTRQVYSHRSLRLSVWDGAPMLSGCLFFTVAPLRLRTETFCSRPTAWTMLLVIRSGGSTLEHGVL